MKPMADAFLLILDGRRGHPGRRRVPPRQGRKGGGLREEVYHKRGGGAAGERETREAGRRRGERTQGSVLQGIRTRTRSSEPDLGTSWSAGGSRETRNQFKCSFQRSQPGTGYGIKGRSRRGRPITGNHRRTFLLIDDSRAMGTGKRQYTSNKQRGLEQHE